VENKNMTPQNTSLISVEDKSSDHFQANGAVAKNAGQLSRADQKTIWIDLDNSPHVPFFMPIIDELRKRGHKVVLTAKDSYQVRDLLDLHGLSCKVIGSHWGKNHALKIIGTCVRSVQLLPFLLSKRPDLAVSHGSRAQLIASTAMGVRKVVIFDYEFASNLTSVRPDWVFMPNLIPDSPQSIASDHVGKYPGLKEDVYVPRMKPDPNVRALLGLTASDIVVVMRPPATEAHYHNPEAETLFDASIDLLTQNPLVRTVLLPRNKKQERALRATLGPWIEKGKIIIPERVIDGLHLIWACDLVISGGGTMNREAAALGIPVYSIFRGRTGAVDRYLADSKRLTMLESVEDVHTKIVLRKRDDTPLNSDGQSAACRFISEGIISIVEHQCLPTAR
jgi:predicted glycosyltransferase